MRRWGSLLGIIALAACRDSTTGPEIVERVEEAQQQLHAGTELRRVSMFLDNVRPMMQMAGILGDITVQVGQRTRTYRGFVWEHLAVRKDPNDGFPCPVVRRWLMAWPKDWDGKLEDWDLVSVSGSDFKQPIRPDRSWCSQAVGALPTRPVVEFYGSADSVTREGLTGRAMIEAGSSGGRSCPINLATSEIRQECETVSYEIDLETSVAPVTWTGRDSLAKATVTGPAMSIRIVPQHVPGFRIKTFCNYNLADILNPPITIKPERPPNGCAWPAHDDSLRKAMWRREDSLHRDSLMRRDSILGDSLDRLDSVWQADLCRRRLLETPQSAPCSLSDSLWHAEHHPRR